MAAYPDRFTLVSGHEWAGAQAPDEEPQNLDDRVPPAHALTLRLMSAWSSKDEAMFTDLFITAAQDRRTGSDHVQDLFGCPWARAWSATLVGGNLGFDHGVWVSMGPWRDG
ncbi:MULTISPECIES: hypothetical protein [unclassified Streptomyces]|uniref:hypothetical protein n=1 Tax=unclassified Streptomyces TaxID=2593676 RepID=UPI003654E6BA